MWNLKFLSIFFQISNFGHFCLEISSWTGLQGKIYAQIRQVKYCLMYYSIPLPSCSVVRQWNRVGLENSMPLFCKWEYSGVSNWEAAYSLCSKGLQSLKVSNIWALPLMALPCNGYKLNLLTSASMFHMALNWKNALNFRMLFCLCFGETCETKIQHILVNFKLWNMFEYSNRYRIKRGIRWNDQILRMFNNYVTISRES